jgi:transcriptional regulator with XRE-family HTH domain
MHDDASNADDPCVAGKVPKILKRKCDTPERAFGAAITDLRLRQGLSSELVAQKVGCNRGYMNEMENGKRNPTFKVLKAIADLHEIRLSVLFARAERKYENCPKKKN